MGKMFFNVLATFAEFEGDLIRIRTRKGMAIACAKGKLRGKQPKLSDKHQKELCRMQNTGQYSISDLLSYFQSHGQPFTEHFPEEKNERLDFPPRSRRIRQGRGGKRVLW